MAKDVARDTGPAVRLPTLLKVGAMLFCVLLAYRFFNQLAHVLLILYAASIVAVGFNSLVQRLPLERKWVVALIGITILSLLVVAVVIGGPMLLEQIRSIAERAPEFEQRLNGFTAKIRQSTGLNIGPISERTREGLSQWFGGQAMMGQARSAIEILLLPLLVVVGALFATASPNDRLLVPLLRVVPRERRAHLRRVLDILGERIGSWMQGQFIAMAAVGTLATIALMIIGVPYALVLGILNGLFEFIPLAGPWMGAAPAVIIATLEDPQKGIYTGIAMFAIQLTEMNLITPFTMSKVADVHPLVTLFALFLFGSIFGFLGMLLALPLVLLIWTFVQVFWVEGAIDTDQDRIADVVEE